MKIGFVLDDTLDSTDGVQQYVLTLGQWYSEQGHEVHYLVGETSRKDLPRVHSLAKNIKVSFNKNSLTVPLPAKQAPIDALISDEHFDVIHVQIPYSPFMAAKVIRAGAKSGTAIVGTFHILPYSGKEQFATKVLGRVLQKTLVLFDSFVAVSQPAREFAEASFGIESEVIPNPVTFQNIQKRKTNNADGIFQIVFLGRLVPRKGSMQLLRAFQKVSSQHDHVRLAICGTGQLDAKLRHYVDQNGLREKVTFTGYLTEAQKYTWLSQADLAVFPSIGGESFGIVLTEAIMAGAGVVIGGNNPGYASVLENPETLVDPNDATEFAACMNRYIIDPSLAQQVHAMQRLLIDKYEVGVVGSKLLALYEQVIAKHKKSKHNT